MFDLEKLATDPRKEEDGVWKPITGDAQVKVARANNPKYRAALMKYQKKFCGLVIDPTSEEFEKAVIYAMAEAILVDWENLAIKGELIPYSVENAIKILTEYPDFKELVSSYAMDADNFRPDEVAKK